MPGLKQEGGIYSVLLTIYSFLVNHSYQENRSHPALKCLPSQGIYTKMEMASHLRAHK